MAQTDSMDKVVRTYFAAMASQPFTYKKQIITPKPLHVGENFFHDYTCKLGCAGCCPRFTLDYLDHEPKPDIAGIGRRIVEVNGVAVGVNTYAQGPKADRRFCDHVDLPTGACGIHGRQPFSCDFETLRFVSFADKVWLGTRPYGRGWNMLRVDGARGALCEFPKTASAGALAEAQRKLTRLAGWLEAFAIPHRVGDVLAWSNTSPTQPRVFT